MSNLDNLCGQRERLRESYVELFETVSQILFECDPVGINFAVNTDEYEPEVGTILPRLKECKSAEDAQRVIHEEFVRWFSAETAGSEEKYADVAGEVWTAWERLRGQARL